MAVQILHENFLAVEILHESFLAVETLHVSFLAMPWSAGHLIFGDETSCPSEAGDKDESFWSCLVTHCTRGHLTPAGCASWPSAGEEKAASPLRGCERNTSHICSHCCPGWGEGSDPYLHGLELAPCHTR